MNVPTLLFERKAQKNDSNVKVIGVDEVGRGSWAGPILSCASWIDPENYNSLPEINDSKKLGRLNRRLVLEKAHKFSKYAICSASVKEIENLGINYANDLASLRAVFSLIKFFEENSKYNLKYILFIDGNREPNFEKFKKLRLIINDKTKIKCVVKGDMKITSVALSSVLAKESRDIIMKRYHYFYPNYNFISNVGYGTKEHRTQLEKFGIIKLHRKNFKPVSTIFSRKK